MQPTKNHLAKFMSQPSLGNTDLIHENQRLSYLLVIVIFPSIDQFGALYYFFSAQSYNQAALLELMFQHCSPAYGVAKSNRL